MPSRRLVQPASAVGRRLTTGGLAVLLLGLAAPAAGEVIDRILAVVSGQVILTTDVAAARLLGFLPDAGASDREALDRLIERALVLGEIDRYAPPEPAETAVVEALDRVRARVADPAGFDAVLVRVGLDIDSVRERIRQDLRMEAYLDQRFTVPALADDEVETAYRSDPAQFARPGVTTFEAARDDVVRALRQARRAPRVAEFVEALRRRTRIVDLGGTDGRGAVTGSR